VPERKSKLLLYFFSIDSKTKLRDNKSSSVDTKLGHKKKAPSKAVEVTWLISIHEIETSRAVDLLKSSFFRVRSRLKYIRKVRIADKTRRFRTEIDVSFRNDPAIQGVTGPYCENAPECTGSPSATAAADPRIYPS
jgi:hypothetical protein